MTLVAADTNKKLPRACHLDLRMNVLLESTKHDQKNETERVHPVARTVSYELRAGREMTAWKREREP